MIENTTIVNARVLKGSRKGRANRACTMGMKKLLFPLVFEMQYMGKVKGVACLALMFSSKYGPDDDAEC